MDRSVPRGVSRSLALAPLLIVAVAPAVVHAQGVDDGSGGKPNVSVEGFGGSMTARVPIAVPAFRGIEPKLALVGSSGSGEQGVLGRSWSLGGPSKVTRTQRRS